MHQHSTLGSGTHLAALMDIYDCNTKSRASTLSNIRADFSKAVSGVAYSSSDRLEKAKAYFEIVDRSVNNSCTV